MIKPFKVNMLTGLVMSIVLLGVISASMTLVTTGVYRDLTFDFQRDYMTQLVSMRAQDILDEQSADAARLGLRVLPRGLHRWLGGAWGKSRDLPEPPDESFDDWYRKNREN